MSRVKNISGGDLDVPLLDRIVHAGEVVDVPDFQPASTPEDPLPIEWPPDKWEAVEEPQAEPEAKPAAKSRKAAG